MYFRLKKKKQDIVSNFELDNIMRSRGGRSGLFGFRIYGVKDFSPIQVFLNFGSGSVRIFVGSGSDNPFKWFLKFNI